MNNWQQQFDAKWGEAPKGSLKYKKGQEMKEFFKTTLGILKDEIEKLRTKRWPEPQPGAGKELGPLAGAGMYLQYDVDRKTHNEDLDELLKILE
jgi:hypothetical protein